MISMPSGDGGIVGCAASRRRSSLAHGDPSISLLALCLLVKVHTSSAKSSVNFEWRSLSDTNQSTCEMV